jgi:hypothetical protein
MPPAERLANAVRGVVYLQSNSPADDPVVRIPQAVEHWRSVFPGLTVVTVTGRAGNWHLPLVERPRETVAAITATYP